VTDHAHSCTTLLLLLWLRWVMVAVAVKMRTTAGARLMIHT